HLRAGPGRRGHAPARAAGRGPAGALARALSPAARRARGAGRRAVMVATSLDTIGALLETRAAAQPDAAALLAPDRPPLTYGGLLEQARALADTLHTLGYGRGDRLAVVLPNGPEMAAAFVGIAASAVCAPLNPADRA